MEVFPQTRTMKSRRKQNLVVRSVERKSVTPFIPFIPFIPLMICLLNSLYSSAIAFS